jgi:transposase-like protein
VQVRQERIFVHASGMDKGASLEESAPRRKRRRWSREVWAREVKAFRDGGLSAEEYAAKRGIRGLTLKRWVRILGEGVKAEEAHRPPSFLPVRIVAPADRPSGHGSFQVEVDLSNGRRVRVRVGAGSDVKSVARLLDALDGDGPC